MLYEKTLYWFGFTLNAYFNYFCLVDITSVDSWMQISIATMRVHFCIKSGYDHYIRMGINPKKLVMGVPWYGYDYTCPNLVKVGKKQFISMFLWAWISPQDYKSNNVNNQFVCQVFALDSQSLES